MTTNKRERTQKTEKPKIEAVSSIPFPKDDEDFMLSLARGLAVINSFSETRRSLTMAEVSQHTKLSRAVARRCLHTLSLLGYVSLYQRHYSLRPKILRLGHSYLASAPLAQLAQPYLEKITKAINESCSIATRDGSHITYIARSASSERIMSVDLRVGSELPAYCTSMGRVLLANLPAAELDQILRSTKLVSHTRFTITDPTLLRALLARTRTQGYCIVDQELEFGLRSIAVPVKDVGGKVVAALNVGVNAGRYSKVQLKELALPVLKAISHELGGLLLSS